MSRIMVANSAANSLSILLEIPSGPTALFVANLDKSYKTSSETDSWVGYDIWRRLYRNQRIKVLGNASEEFINF